MRDQTVREGNGPVREATGEGVDRWSGPVREGAGEGWDQYSEQ